MLNELRDQQNMMLKCIKQWIILQVKHTSRLNELEINQNTIKTQEETITKLQAKVLTLKKTQHSSDQYLSHQLIKSADS